MRLEVQALALEQLLAFLQLQPLAAVEGIEKHTSEPHHKMPRQTDPLDIEPRAPPDGDVHE